MSAKKEKSTSYATNNQTATTTPDVPTWLQQPYQGVTGQINNLVTSGQPLVSGPSDLQNTAFQGAQNLSTSPLFGQAADLAGRAANAGASSAGPAREAVSRNFTDVDLQGYMNPYLAQVMGAYTTDFDANAGRVNAAQDIAGAANGGARNSNNAVQQAITQGELARARGTGVAGIQSDAFNTAAGLATGDLNREASTSQFNAGQANNMSQFNAGQQDNALARMLAGAGTLGQLGQAQGQDERALIGLQYGLGEQQRDIENQTSEASRLAMLTQLLGGVPIDQFTGRTVTSDGTQYGKGSSTSVGAGLDDVGKLMAMFSDERLKRDIKTEGYDAKGRRWVSWRYVWDKAARHLGVIAQEVQKTDPQAVIVHPSGYLMVNYGAL